MRETQFGGLRRKEKRISAFRGCETPSRPTKKRLRAASNFVGEYCRSHSLAELRWKGHWCSCTVLAQTPLLGHPRAFQRYFAYQVPHSGRPCNHVTVTEPSEKKVARKLAISRQSPRPKIKGIHLIDSTCYANQDAVLNPCRNGSF